MLDWASYGTPSHAAAYIGGQRLLAGAASLPRLPSLPDRRARGLSAVWRRCDRVRPPHARPVTRRELVTKIDASTNNPEGNRVSGRIDDSTLHRPASAMFHILRTTFVGEKVAHLLRPVHNTVGTLLKPRCMYGLDWYAAHSALCVFYSATSVATSRPVADKFVLKFTAELGLSARPIQVYVHERRRIECNINENSAG